MNTESDTDHESTDPHTDKRLGRAVNHVMKLWMPINADVLKQIREGFESGRYKGNRAALIDDLKGDFSLFTWCLRNLCELVDDGPERDPNFDPLQHLNACETGALQVIFDVDADEITVHELDGCDETQLRILQNAILSASTAELLSKNKGIESSRAYGAALLRQLGLTLIVWNYPTVVQEALAKMEHGGDLELEIAERLGFSPSLFAMKIVQKWGMSEEQCHAMGISRTKAGAEVLATEDSKESDDEAGPKSAAPKETSDYLAEVCAIGELLAQANDPASYPKQKGEWDSLEKHIEQALGPRGLMRVRERFQENCQSYVKALPGILEGSGALFDRERYPDSPVIQRALRKNKYILNCDGSVQMDLKRLYTLLDEQTTVNRETVRRLVHEMIPEAGFSAGCVYTFDPSMSVLVPQMKIGTVSAHEVKSVNVSIQGTDEHPVSKAFRSPEPILAYSYTEDDRPLIAIAGPFGQHRRFGVLYLESEVQNLSDENAQESVRIHFRAFAKALNDCLKL